LYNKTLIFFVPLICGIVSSCGGESSPPSPPTPESSSNTSTPIEGGGAAEFTAALSISDSLIAGEIGYPERVAKMQALARIAYIDGDTGTINYDYEDTNADGYHFTNDSTDGSIHPGIDFQSSSRGTDIGSLVSGEVVAIDNPSGSVIIESLVGNDIVRVTHMHLEPIYVAEGAFVDQGDVIGFESNNFAYRFFHQVNSNLRSLFAKNRAFASSSIL